MLLPIIIATITVSLVSLVGILLIFRKDEKRNLKPLISLAAGSLLGVAFLDLLPEAIEESAGSFEPHFISLVVLLSILGFFVLERVIHWHHCGDEEIKHVHKKHSIVSLNLIGDFLHNVIDGFLIAAAFLLDFNTGVLVTIAVILHEIPQEIFDFGVLLYGGLSKLKALALNLLVALTAVVGAVVFYYFGEQFEYLVPVMAAIAVGNFIYLSIADLIPELHHETKRSKIIQHTVLLFVGVLIIYSINAALPHGHGEEQHDDDHAIEELHDDDHHEDE